MIRESQVGQIPQHHVSSPYEAAFDAELQTNFGTRLRSPFVDQCGNLVRVSDPTVNGDRVLAFQYTRFEPLRSGDGKAIVLMDLDHNTGFTAVDLVDKLEDFIEEMQRRVITRDGKFDQLRALTNPNYYGGSMLVRWSEGYDFTLVNTEVDRSELTKPTTIHRGRVFGDRRADMHIYLAIPSRYEGMDSVPGFDENATLTLRFPALRYRVSKAFAEGYSMDNHPLPNRLDYDDVNYFPLAKDIEIPVYLMDYLGRGRKDIAPEQVMGRIGRFITRLLIQTP